MHPDVGKAFQHACVLLIVDCMAESSIQQSRCLRSLHVTLGHALANQQLQHMCVYRFCPGQDALALRKAHDDVFVGK